MTGPQHPIPSTIPSDDRGLAYGDGLFETMRVWQARVPLLQRHLDRLLKGCRRLGIPAPSRDILIRHVEDAVESLDNEGIVKLMLTRGSGGRGYRPGRSQPRLVTSAHPLPEHLGDRARTGAAIQLCTTRIGRNPATAGLKHLGRLEQVLAAMELRDDVDEGLMLDELDHVIEGTRSNLFLAGDDRLVTPALDFSGVAGVMRDWVIQAASGLGMAVEESAISVDDLARANEIFLTNSVIGIWPVVSIRGLDWESGCGPMTSRLVTALGEEVGAWDD